MADPTTSIFSVNNTILLDVSINPIHLEATAAAGTDIIPGHLINYDADGNFILQAGDNPTVPIFAIEKLYKGSTIDDHYLPGETVYAINCRAGDVILAWLQEGRQPSIGDFLRCAGGGGGDLREDPAVGPGAYVGVALEAIDTTGTGIPGRIKVQVL